MKCAWAEKVDKVVFKFMYFISILAAIALIVAALLCTVDSLSTTIFSHSVPNGTAWVAYLNIPVVFLAMGFIQVERGNTIVDLLFKKFPKSMQKVIEFFGCLLGFAISAYLAYLEFGLTMNKMSTGAKASSAANSFVIWPFALVIAIGYALVAISFLWCIFRIFLIPPERRQGALIMPDDPFAVPTEPVAEGAGAPKDMTPLPDPGLGRLAKEVDENEEKVLNEKRSEAERREEQ